MEFVSDGLVMFKAIVGKSVSSHMSHVESTIYRLLHAEADIFAFLPQPSSSSSTIIRGLIEFCDVDLAVTVANKFRDFIVDVGLSFQPPTHVPLF
jgi:hypothetical protein